MGIEAPTADFVRVIDDSRRWQHVPHRSDDIVITTPPKCGTTWTQGIVSSLLWPDGDAPGMLGERSPWVDVKFAPIAETAATLAAQQHRRFIKTHSPGDCVPFDSDVHYVVVSRSAPDALVSWGNHRAAMHPEITAMLNDLAAADGLEPLPLTFDGDSDELFDEWTWCCSPARHLASWWPRRHLPNVMLLHYADMYADLDGWMRQIAAFLDIDIEPDQWPEVVDRCRLAEMREAARATGRMERGFNGGADAFFHRGGNGRGRELLSDAQIDRCTAHCAEHLIPEAVDFLQRGAVALT